jgi:hypothetical protein
VLNFYQITLPYACFGVFFHPTHWYVYKTAPIGKWMIGKHFYEIEKWVRKKGGTLKKIPQKFPE